MRLRLRSTVDWRTVAVGEPPGPHMPPHAGTGCIATARLPDERTCAVGGSAYYTADGVRIGLSLLGSGVEPSIGCDRRSRRQLHPADLNYSNGLPTRRTRARRRTGARSVQLAGCEANSVSVGSIDLP